MAERDSLSERLQRREADALSEFLVLYQPQLLAFIARRLGSALQQKIEAQDLFQEMAIAAVKALPTTDLSDREPFGWLCQIAEQRIIDASRKFLALKRSSEREVAIHAPAPGGEHEILSLLAASVTSPTGAFARAERHQQLQRALAELPADTRDILKWRYVDNLATKEIAARTGKSDGAIRVLLTRTIHRLQEILSDQGLTSM
jgi:RNA polymerase sigma-70 factor (ECF subfamily)